MIGRKRRDAERAADEIRTALAKPIAAIASFIDIQRRRSAQTGYSRYSPQRIDYGAVKDSLFDAVSQGIAEAETACALLGRPDEGAFVEGTVRNALTSIVIDVFSRGWDQSTGRFDAAVLGDDAKALDGAAALVRERLKKLK
jgi:hypothetical protein